MGHQALAIVCGIALSIFLAGLAEASDLSYTYVEAGYVDLDFDSVNDIDLDGDGWGIFGSLAINDLVHVFGGYATVDLDVDNFDIDADYDTWEMGFGAHYGIADNLDVVGTVSYVNADVETDVGDADDDGFGVSARLRGRLANQFELEGGISYVDLDNAGNDFSVGADARWYFIETLALGFGYTTGDDVSAWTASLRWEMPKQ